MILDLILHSARNRSLTLFNARIHELFDLAAIQTHDVIVVLAFIQLKDRGGAFEVMTTHQPRSFELRKNSVHGCKPNVFMRFQQVLVDVFSTHVPRRCRAENLENLDARQRDFESGLAQIVGFQGSPRRGSQPLQ